MRAHMKRLLSSLCTAVILCGLTACSNTATPEPTSTPPATPVSPSPTAAPAIALLTPTTTPPFRRSPPSGTPTPDPSRGLPEVGVITTTYTVRAGDTLSGIAVATGATLEELQRLNNLRNPNALQAGQQLLILRQITGRAPSVKLIPDSELVNSPTAADFDVDDFVSRQRGYLDRYTEDVAGGTLTGAQIVQRIADQFSVHPRILLTALEYAGGWVTKTQPSPDQILYPLGYKRTNLDGLNVQLTWAAARLNEGYYGWRLGNRNFARLDDGDYVFFGDGINAGTAGLQNYLAAISAQPAWQTAMAVEGSRAFVTTYRALFGDPWQNDLGQLVPDSLQQPPLSLPWTRGEMWFFTGGPHSSWGRGTPWGALDFTTASVSGCGELPEWLTAVADGVITRSINGEVGLALDPSGDERIGWSVLYLHVSHNGRVAQGKLVKAGDRIGHPSCEGGLAEAAHVHIARKYNGEWINAEGAIPFDLGGWVAGEGDQEYDGTLTRGDQTRQSCECKLPNVNGVTW